MSDFDRFRKEAEELGLKGNDFASYVVQQQNQARQDRAKEREFQQAKLEAEKAKLEAENEKARIDADLQKVKLQHDLDLARLNTPASLASSGIGDSALRPKLPLFKDGDDITSFLIRFERIAELLNVDKDSYAVRLGSLLTGRAVEIYTSLSPDITKDYDLLKAALIRGFNKTPNGYRNDFRTAKIGPNETYEQFSIMLGRHFDSWVNACDVTQDYASLRDFCLLDQFIASLSPELRTYIKEHRISTLSEAGTLADNWASAHSAYPKQKQSQASDKGKRIIAPKPSDTVSSSKSNSSKIICHYCGEAGHIKPKCPNNPYALKQNSANSPHKVQFCMEDKDVSNECLTTGTVNGAWVSTILRDTGCNCVIVSDKVLPDADIDSVEKACVEDYLGRLDYFPKIKCYLRCPYYEGWVEALRAPIKFCGVLIGNIKGAKRPDSLMLSKSDNVCPDLDVGCSDSDVSDDLKSLSLCPDSDQVSQCSSPASNSVFAVQTRASKAKKVHPLILPKLEPLNVTPVEFSKLQLCCPSLLGIRDKVTSGEHDKVKDGSEFKYEKVNDLLYRTCVASKFPDKIGNSALVVPQDCRQIVLSVGHESPLAGHFSHRKTEMRIRDNFFWPNMGSDIRTFCRSCDKCQRMSSQGRVKPVPLKQMPIITEPFSRVSMDLVGPLSPPSSDGHRYILTLIDFATGFPEALPLKEIDSISVAEALMVIFSRVGIPKEILSDRDTQFTFHLMGELHKLLGIKPLFTTPYHPSGNGRIERFHSTLKASLRKLCSDKPREWHRYLIPTLFALREIPSDRTGFSAFELLYGRRVRGPPNVLRDLLLGACELITKPVLL